MCRLSFRHQTWQPPGLINLTFLTDIGWPQWTPVIDENDHLSYRRISDLCSPSIYALLFLCLCHVYLGQ